MQTPDLVRKDVHLDFTEDISGQPVICNMMRDFDLTFNILQARINLRREGFLLLRLEGAKENIEKALARLKAIGVKITIKDKRITRVEELCMHCGMCISLCPSDALHMDNESRLLQMDQQKCTVCGLCAKVCPVKAMIAENGA